MASNNPLDNIEQYYNAHIQTLQTRYSQALSEHEFDAAVIFSGALHTQFMDDTTYPFKPNPHFKNWVPLTQLPESFIVLRSGTLPHLIYCQPDDYWHKTPDAPDGFWAEHFEITIISTMNDAKLHMPKGRVAFLGEWQEQFETWAKFDANPRALINQLHYERAWKTEYELACMQKASDIAALGHRAALLAFNEECSEYDMHLAYCAACEVTEDQLPYDSIIALNRHAAILHYTYRDTTIVQRDQRKSFLIDAGASFNGYASDVTRSYAYADGAYADLIAHMDRLQQIVCDQVLPGVRYVQLHLDTYRAIGGILHSANLIKLNGDDAAESGLTSTFFPHGLGHYIGLQVHDVGGFMKDASGEHVPPPEGHDFLRLTRRIDTHQVMTIEPGIYFIESLLKKLKNSDLKNEVNWDAVEQLMPYGGIRIEDNVVVTDNGPINLTRNAFSQLVGPD